MNCLSVVISCCWFLDCLSISSSSTLEQILVCSCLQFLLSSFLLLSFFYILPANVISLFSTPVRNLIRNPHYIDAILASLERMHSRGCSPSVRIVWIHTMPYPSCDDYDLCLETQHFKTNPSIHAMSQYFTSELQKSTYENLVIVEAMDIIRPSRKGFDCMNHFLCKHGPNQRMRMSVSNAGAALADEISIAMCRGVVSEMN